MRKLTSGEGSGKKESERKNAYQESSSGDFLFAPLLTRAVWAGGGGFEKVAGPPTDPLPVSEKGP